MEINKKFDFSKLKKPLLIICIIAIIAIIAFLVNKYRTAEIAYTNNYDIVLLGDEEITIYKGEEYQEPGYSGTDSNNKDVTGEINVTDNIDTKKIGTYKVTYTIGNVTKERTVKVIAKPVGYTYIHLYGEVNTFIYVGEKYQEKGYIVIDSIDGDRLNEKVTVKSDLDTSKEGIYKIVYSVTNSGGVTTSKERYVIVMDRNLSLIPNTKELTKDNVTISIYVKDEQFNYITLPNGQKKSERTSSYEVSNNGTYKFVMYNKNGQSKEKSITITNIDKESPSGSCTGTYGSGITQINIDAKDNVGINRYVINDTAYTTNSIRLNGEYSSVNVTIYDKVGNNKTIACNINNNVGPTATPVTPFKTVTKTPSPSPTPTTSYYYPTPTRIPTVAVTTTKPITTIKPAVTTKPATTTTKPVVTTVKPTNTPTKKPTVTPTPAGTSTATYQPTKPPIGISYTINTSTLKVWMEKKSRYYISHVWASDPYNQVKVATPSNWSKTVEYASDILKNAVTTHGYQGKAIFAVNGSAFINKPVFGQSQYPDSWNYTSASPIIIVEGKTLRDSTNNVPNNMYTYGLKSNGDLAYYYFKQGANLTENANARNRLIADGIKNTTAFSTVLVKNGQVNTTATATNMRQGWCQINKNNFIFITNHITDRSLSLSLADEAAIMVDLGCKTGVRLDGGGSTTLLIKDRNNKITTLVGNTRQIADVLYFHE